MKAYLQTKADGQWCAAVWQDGEITQESVEKWAQAHAVTLGLAPDSLGWVLSPDDDKDLREGELLDVAPAPEPVTPSRAALTEDEIIALKKIAASTAVVDVKPMPAVGG